MNDWRGIDIIAGLRGGYPDKCDFCGQPMKPEDAIPEEAGDWACRECWDRWESESQALPPFEATKDERERSDSESEGPRG